MESWEDLEQAITDARRQLLEFRGEGVADQGRVRATVEPGGELTAIVIDPRALDSAGLGAHLVAAINSAQDDLPAPAGSPPTLTEDLARAEQRVREQASAIIDELEAALARLPEMLTEPEVTPARWDGWVALASFGADVNRVWHRTGELLDTVDTLFDDDPVGELLRGSFSAVRELVDESLPSIADDFGELGAELAEAAGIPEDRTGAPVSPPGPRPATGPPLALPASLATAAAAIGRRWPVHDEPGVLQVAAGFVAVGGELRGIRDRCESHVRAVLAAHQGPDVDAFAEEWRDLDRAPSVLRDAAVGTLLVGPGTMLAAGLVLALKTVMIAQLALLQLQTAGAPPAWHPTARHLTSLGIDVVANTIIQELEDDEEEEEDE